MFSKKSSAFGDGHVEDVGDRLALVRDFECLAVVAFAVADLAGHEDIGQEVHLDLDDALALAGFAATAFDVEREAAGHVAARFASGHRGEELADRGEESGVGGRVRARRAADRALVDVDHLVEMLDAVECRRARPVVRAASWNSCASADRGCR